MSQAYMSRLQSAYREASNILVVGDRVQVESPSKYRPINYTFSEWKSYFAVSKSGIPINPIDIVKVNGVNTVFGDMDTKFSNLLLKLSKVNTTDQIKSTVSAIDKQYRDGLIYIHEQEWPLIEEVARESLKRLNRGD